MGMVEKQPAAEVYFYDDTQVVLTIIRGPGMDEWKEETIEDEEEYFRRKLIGK